MNWVKKIFGKKEHLTSEVRFEELSEWLDARLDEISGEACSRAARLYRDIEYTLEEIKKSASLLEKAEPAGRFHLRMVRIGTSNRDNMVKQVRMLIDNIAVPKKTDISTILLFHKNAMQSLTVCLDNMLRSHHYTKQVFPEESKEVVADVNELGRLLNRLIEPIENRKNILDALENAEKTVQSIKNLFSDIEIEKRTIKEKEEKFMLLNHDMEEKQKDLVRLRDSSTWKQFMVQKNELLLLENKAEKIESEINSLVLPLNKALNRLRQLSESGRYTLKPWVREGLYRCISDPGSVSPEFFTEVKKIVESDALNLASGRKDKMLEQIGIAESSFGSYKTQYQTLVKDIENKKDDISKLDIIQEEKNLNDSIRVSQDKLAALEKELETSKRHLVSLEEEVELKKQELQKSISVIDSRVKVLFS